jgi:hypothetical protein
VFKLWRPALICGAKQRSWPDFVSGQFEAELAAHRQSGALQRVQCNAGIRWIKQTVEGPAAGSHADGHGSLSEAVFLHGGFDLIGQDLFDGLFLAVFENSLLGQKAVKRRTDLSPFCLRPLRAPLSYA